MTGGTPVARRRAGGKTGTGAGGKTGTGAGGRPEVDVVRREGRHIRSAAFGLLVVGVLVAVIGLGAAAGAWQTTGRVTADGQVVAPQGESAGEVKGWMAVGDVASAFGVPLPELLTAFGLPPDTAPNTALKDLESETFSVSALRDWLAARSP